MLKKIFLFMMVIVLLVMASCVPATTPEQSYATEMQPAVELLGKWQNDFMSIEQLLTDTLDEATGVTRLQLIELYNIATEYQINRNDYSSLGFIPLDALVGPTINLSKDGQTILDILSAITPLEETKTDHQIILECIQIRIAFADELSSSIKDLNSVDLNKAGDLIACEPFADSLEKLTTFVNDNK